MSKKSGIFPGTKKSPSSYHLFHFWAKFLTVEFFGFIFRSRIATTAGTDHLGLAGQGLVTTVRQFFLVVTLKINDIVKVNSVYNVGRSIL